MVPMTNPSLYATTHLLTSAERMASNPERANNAMLRTAFIVGLVSLGVMTFRELRGLWRDLNEKEERAKGLYRGR